MGTSDETAGPPAEAGSKTLGPVTPLMIDQLRRTKPWVRFMSILGFIGSGLMLILAVVMPLLASFSGEFGGMVGGIAMGALYFCGAIFYVFPSLFLYRYASAIRTLLETGESASMELALSYQTRFWRLVGIASLVIVCLYGVAFLGAVGLGIGAALLNK